MKVGVTHQEIGRCSRQMQMEMGEEGGRERGLVSSVPSFLSSSPLLYFPAGLQESEGEFPFLFSEVGLDALSSDGDVAGTTIGTSPTSNCREGELFPSSR